MTVVPLRVQGVEPAEFQLPLVSAEALAQTLSEQIIYLNLKPGTHLTEDDV